MKEITGFTPGPWEVGCGRYLLGHRADGRYQQIATFENDDDWEAEQSANRELCLAAPKLYAECQTLRSQRAALREALKDLVDYCDLQLRTVYDGAVDEIRERLQSVLDATKEPVCK